MDEHTKRIILHSLLLPLAVLAACSPAPLAVAPPIQVAATSTPEPSSAGSLDVRFTYPTETTELENGQSARFMVAVDDRTGGAVDLAHVVVRVHAPDGQVVVSLTATPYWENVYRTELWSVPRRMPPGRWVAQALVTAPTGQSTATGPFQVKSGVSEVLLNKYGFWLNAPTMRGIVPTLAAEKGDARRGLVRWGGIIPSDHVLPANWIDLHWRTGDFHLVDEAAVRRFMLEELGDLAFTPIRALGPFEQTRFGQWQAWKVGARAKTRQDLMEWLVFFAAEDGRTFALGTTVVAPPEGIDAHAQLRSGFAVFPEQRAAGTAPQPLPSLEPAPELIGPSLGADYEGVAQPVRLEWRPTRPLRPNEYYRVSIDYDYKETNTVVRYATREPQFTLPEELYRAPNCRVFNWQVTVMRETGVDHDENPEGVPVTYDSMYSYVRWFYPTTDPAPFTLACPNALF